MIKKKIILSLLVFTMSLYICHDMLPYHNHGMSHFFNGNKYNQVIKDINDNNDEHDCDGHGLCVVCLLKDLAKLQINHLEIDFSVNPTNLVIKIEKIKVPGNQYSYLHKNENSHRYKSKYFKQAQALRAPPSLV